MVGGGCRSLLSAGRQKGAEWRLMTPSADHCRRVVPLFRERDGQETKVLLSGARTLRVFNIAWGQDLGDDFEHITSNISPWIDESIDIFFTDEIASVVDPASGELLWETDGIPTFR
jgi:hypothetical protein